MSAIVNTQFGVLTFVPGEGGGIADEAGITVPADGTPGYIKGATFRHTDGSAGDTLYVNMGNNTSSLFVAVPSGNQTGAADVGIADAGNFTTTTDVEGSLQEIYQNILSTVAGTINLPINGFLEIATSGNVGNTVQGGGKLANDTSPALNTTSNETLCIVWPTSNQDEISMTLALPPNIIGTLGNATLRLNALGGSGNAPAFSANISFNDGTQYTANATGTANTVKQTLNITIPNANIPASPTFMNVQIRPLGTHTTDALTLYSAIFLFKPIILTS